MFREFFRRFGRWLRSRSIGHPVGVCSKCHETVYERDGHYEFSRYAEDSVEEIDLFHPACAPKIRNGNF